MRLVSYFLALMVLASSALAQPAISTDQQRGEPDDNITVSGSGFSGSELIDIYFDKTGMAVARADSGGVFSRPLRIPKSADPGQHTISAVGRQGQRSAQTGFTVQRAVIIEGNSPSVVP
jgi:hypothetical protein